MNCIELFLFFSEVEHTFIRSQLFNCFVLERWLNEAKEDITESPGLFSIKLLLVVMGEVYFFASSVCTTREPTISFPIEDLK